MRKPVVLVTGAGGEIGHGLITRLADERVPIITLDLTPIDPSLAPAPALSRGRETQYATLSTVEDRAARL